MGNVSGWSEEQLHECKLRFAKLSLDCRPGSESDIINTLLMPYCPNGAYPNSYYTIMYASSWPFDPVVVAEKERLLAETASKTQIIRELHNIARGGHKDSLAAYRLMAEIQQWVGHGSVSTVKDAKNGRASDGQMAELAALVVNSPQVKDSGV